MEIIIGTRMLLVRAVPNGPKWRRYIDQVQAQHALPEDDEPGDTFTLPMNSILFILTMTYQIFQSKKCQYQGAHKEHKNCLNAMIFD